VSRVFGQGPFVEVGDPTAVVVSPDLIVVGGDLGAAQWNARSVHDRSDRTVGWFPIGLYSPDLTCRRVLTSRWMVNSIALHPAGGLVAIGTGAYDGGYLFEGELLVHDVARGTTTSVLDGVRCVESVAWTDDRTLGVTVAPPTDDLREDEAVTYDSYAIRRDDWQELGPGGIVLGNHSSTTGPRPTSPPSSPSRTLRDLAAGLGRTWEWRRHAWAVAAAGDGGPVVGSDGRIERWSADDATRPTWRFDLDGTCTQLVPAPGGGLVAAVWDDRDDRAPSTTALAIDVGTGRHEVLRRSSHPAVLVPRTGGEILVRDTRHGPREAHPAPVVAASGERVGEVDLTGYDLFNHYFDIQGSDDFLVLVGDQPAPHRDKQVAEVRRTESGAWTVRPLFALAWDAGQHLFGGPGVVVDDAAGRSIVHAGAIHDGRGLLPGNAFVVRRAYADGQLQWHVALDDQVTAVAARDGRVVAATNLGAIVVVDAATGNVLATDTVAVGGARVVPLSLALPQPDVAWIGTLDGRVVEVRIDAPQTEARNVSTRSVSSADASGS
jgi:hypothetical protein